MGRATAKLFADYGAKVAASDLNEDSVNETVAEINKADRNAHAWQLDVTDKAAIQATINAAAEHYGGIDVLVNNAGISLRTPIDDVEMYNSAQNYWEGHTTISGFRGDEPVSGIGFTELTERLDPEDLSDLIGDYQRAAVAVIKRYDGFVARYFGDGILAIPGVACLWPRLSQGPGAIGAKAREWIENGTPVAERATCPVDLSTLRASYGPAAGS